MSWRAAASHRSPHPNKRRYMRTGSLAAETGPDRIYKDEVGDIQQRVGIVSQLAQALRILLVREQARTEGTEVQPGDDDAPGPPFSNRKR